MKIGLLMRVRLTLINVDVGIPVDDGEILEDDDEVIKLAAASPIDPTPIRSVILCDSVIAVRPNPTMLQPIITLLHRSIERFDDAIDN